MTLSLDRHRIPVLAYQGPLALRLVSDAATAIADLIEAAGARGSTRSAIRADFDRRFPDGGDALFVAAWTEADLAYAIWPHAVLTRDGEPVHHALMHLPADAEFHLHA